MKFLTLLSLVSAATALSCENPFGYSYIAETIKPGKYEIEQYITGRFGRDIGTGYDARYRGFDFKTELEIGISKDEQVNIEPTALYLDSASFEGLRFNGINLSYKKMLADPDRTSWGRAIYLEPGFSQVSSKNGALRDRWSFEGKYILQHNFGDNSPWMYVANLVGEVTHISSDGEDAVEFKITQGLAYQLTKDWTIGLESIAMVEWVEFNNFEEAGFFVGPCLNYRRDDFSATLTMLAQVAGAPVSKGNLNVVENSPYEARLTVAWEF